MSNIYKNLIGIASEEKYPNGAVKSCILEKENKILTVCGELIPKYSEENVRKKYKASISFFKSGEIKSIYMENQTPIKTPLGVYPAEFVTFYESGALKRFFPLDGKISGYWTEDDEANLCENLQFSLDIGTFKAKIINVCFYENGNLKSVTLWPGQEIILNTNVGLLPVRIGFSLHENGTIETIEPAYEIPVLTPIGIINAYDETAVGIIGDKNSLEFDVEGNVISIITSTSRIAIFAENNKQETAEPSLKSHPLEDDKFIKEPLKIVFDNNMVYFYNDIKDVRQYSLDSCKFVTINDNPISNIRNACPTGGDCLKCSLCK
ncbi:MAG: hypothetical protein N2171_02250 [Clostridia bacterium]|nr:hypothetical protein [Clostridia bacterium]